MSQHVPNAPQQNLCTQILSSDVYESDKGLFFEPNLISVHCHKGHARSTSNTYCTAVSSAIFDATVTQPRMFLAIKKFSVDKAMSVGIVPEKPHGHDHSSIGSACFPSFGVEILYLQPPEGEESSLIELKYLDSRSNSQCHEEDSPGEKYSLGKFESTFPHVPDEISLLMQHGRLVFFLNGQFIQSINTEIPRKYRFGVSFSSMDQEVLISLSKIDHFTTCEENLTDKLPHLPLRTEGKLTLLPLSPELLVFDNTTLCTSDEGCAAISAEIFECKVWESSSCQGCGAQQIVSNKWQCMECSFDMCDRCFDRFSADPQRNLFHHHSPDAFTCSLGGECHTTVARIEDVCNGNTAMFFGIAPRQVTSSDAPTRSELYSFGLKVGDAFSIVSEGREERVPFAISVSVGDLIQLSLEKQRLKFYINGDALGETRVPLGKYRFVLVHYGGAQSVSIVEGNHAKCIPRGDLVKVDATRTVLEKNCQDLSIAVPFEVLGQYGHVVASDDIDGTVGVNFANTFRWLPRTCCTVVAAALEATKYARQRMSIPHVGDAVVLHPFYSNGKPRPLGGVKGEIINADVNFPTTHDYSNQEVLSPTISGKGYEPCSMRGNYVNYELKLDLDHESTPYSDGHPRYNFTDLSIGSFLVRLEKEAMVIRNPFFWRWGAQDGQSKAIFIQKVTRIPVGWVVDLPEHGWVVVFWEETRVCEKYRWGFDDAFDVICVCRPFELGHRPMPALHESKLLEFSNPNTYSSFIKECHYIPLQDLKFEQTSDYEIGRGRFGVVYKGLWGERVVAIKEISDLSVHQARDLGILSRIDHPNVIRIHGWSSDQRKSLTVYLVMDIIVPGSLSKVIREMPITDVQNRRAIDWKDFYDIAISIAGALHYFARQGLVHRDIKPENILISIIDGKYKVRVTDFGLARFSLREESTELSNVCGTPAYMSPEAWETGKKIDDRADVFSFGLVMVFMLTGITPRSHCENAFQILYDLVTSKNIVQPPEGIPDGLRDLIIACQSHLPASRPSSMEVTRKLVELRERMSVSKREIGHASLSKDLRALSLKPLASSTNSSLVPKNAPRCPTFRQVGHHREYVLPPQISVPDYRVTYNDLIDELHFTHESATILFRLPEISAIKISSLKGGFSREKRSSLIQEAIFQLLIPIKLISEQTKLTYEFLFSAIAKAKIPLLEQHSSDGVSLYFVLSKHYSRFISLTRGQNHSPVKKPAMNKPRVSLEESNDLSGSSFSSRHLLGLIAHEPAKFRAENHPPKANIQESPEFPDGRVKPFIKSQIAMNYLSFENFCLYADISWTSLMCLIESQTITPRRIFGQTYRISCEQKELLEELILSINKFCTSCALTATEIRAFALLVQVPVLYRPASRDYCLLYTDINSHIMPEMDRAAAISTRPEFIDFLDLQRSDIEALEARGILEKQMSFDRLKIFEYITLVVSCIVPLSIAQNEIQHILDLSEEEFRAMLEEYTTKSMLGMLQIKKNCYLFREDLQKLMLLFSD